MKTIKILLIIIMLTVCMSTSAKVTHYLGGMAEFNFGYTSMNVIDYHFAAGANYVVRFHKYFSLENQIMLGYSFLFNEMNLDDRIFTINEHELILLYGCYPLINLGNKLFNVTISTLGFKLKYAPTATRHVLDKVHGMEFSDFSNITNTRLLIGISEKIGVDIVAGKRRNVIISIFYANIDVLFNLIEYEFDPSGYPTDGDASKANAPLFTLNSLVLLQTGIGTSVTFKLNNRKESS